MIQKSHIDKALARLDEVERHLSDPSAPSNRKLFKELLQEHSALTVLRGLSTRYLDLEREIREHRELVSGEGGDPELVELAASELGGLESKLVEAEKNLLFALLPPDPDDARNAIMEIRAGTGGDEAALFAGDLYRMYGRYADSRGWSVGLVDASTTDIGGYKEVVFTVEGKDVYGSMRFESGVHRVQRIPVTEASGRIHTSAATVAVFPEAEPDDDINIPPDELRVDIYCASGPGGQGVNTTYSAVRVTHLPTGIVAQSQDERSQHRNRERALAVLRARLLDHRRQEEEARMGNTRRAQIGSGDRSERIRTYNFPQNRVTDHRIGLTLYSLDRVIQGEVDPLVRALSAEHREKLLKQRGLV